METTELLELAIENVKDSFAVLVQYLQDLDHVNLHSKEMETIKAKMDREIQLCLTLKDTINTIQIWRPSRIVKKT